MIIQGSQKESREVRCCELRQNLKRASVVLHLTDLLRHIMPPRDVWKQLSRDQRNAGRSAGSASQASLQKQAQARERKVETMACQNVFYC